MKLEIHEKILYELFKSDEEILMFDIGACEGLSSKRYLELFPNGKIYAFEPLPGNYEITVKNKEKYNLTNLIPYKLGLSSITGKAKFHVSSGQPENVTPEKSDMDFGNKSSSLLPPDKTKDVFPWLKFEDEIEIDTLTLDNFCEQQKIFGIDFIHMDVQGAELLVLQGARETLSNVKAIWLEVENISLYQNQPLENEIGTFLIYNNFVRVLSTVNHITGDQFWVQKSYLNQLNKANKSKLSKIKIQNNIKMPMIRFIGIIRYKMKLRTRIKALLGYKTK